MSLERLLDILQILAVIGSAIESQQLPIAAHLTGAHAKVQTTELLMHRDRNLVMKMTAEPAPDFFGIRQ